MSSRFSRLILVSTLLIGPSAQAGSAPVDNLLSFFGSTCPSEQGGWTQAALGKASALRTALEDISKDPDCQSLSDESVSASAITASLTILNQQVVNNATDITLASQEQAVLSSMASVTDPAGLTGLQSLLAKIDARSISTQANDRLAVQATAANQLIASTHGLVQQAVNSQQCLLKRPGLFATIGSLVANVGAAVTAVNPVLGLGTSALGTVVSDLVKLGHQKKILKQIRKLNEGAFQPEAVACVLESLTDDYCRADDALKTMQWAEAHKMRRDYPITSPLFGLGILDRELNVLSRWLAKVKVSRLAQNPADAARKQEFRNMEAAYLNSPDLFSGTIETFRNQLDGVTDMKKRWPIIRTMITAIVSSVGQSGQYESGSRNPLFLTKNRNEAEFFLIGIDPLKLDPVNGGEPSFENNYSPEKPQHIPQTPATLIPDIQHQFDAWFADTKKLVDDLRVQTQTADMLGTLESAFTPVQDYGRDTVSRVAESATRTAISPYSSLTIIQEYLGNQLRQNAGESESFYYLPETLTRLGTIRDQLESLHTRNQTRTDKDYGDILSRIYTASNLEQGSSFIENRVGDHVNSALIRYLSDPANQNDTAPILAETLASERMTDFLLKSNPLGDRAKVSADILNSETIILPTFTTFVDTFRKEIGGALQFLQGQEVLWGPVKGEAFYKKRARICLMLTALPSWPADVSYDLCRSTSFRIVPGGPLSPVLTPDYMATAVEKRSCGFYDLEKSTLIHQAKMDFNVL